MTLASLLLYLATHQQQQWSIPINMQNQAGYQYHQYGLDARTVDSATNLAATKVFLANVRPRIVLSYSVF